MLNYRSIHSQRGVSLVEVLVAVIVFAVGLLAIASLQGALVRTGNDAKARSVAVNLAEQKLEDFRAFVDGADFQAIADGSESFTGTDAVSGVNMVRSWDVEDYWYVPDGTSNSMSRSTSGSGAVDAKRVQVTVAWCDAGSPSGCNPADLSTDPETVSVADVLAKTEPAGSAKSITELNIGNPPEIPYSPGEAPEVISIDLEDGTKKESPEPVIRTTRKQNEASDSVEYSTITRFDAITFIPPPSGEEGVTVRRQEFVTVNCTCVQEGLPTDGDEASYGRTPVFWDGEKYVGGVKVRKPVGSSTLDQADVSSLQFIQPLCNTCCRDHHDAPADTTFDHDNDSATAEISVDPYDPFRPDGTINDGDHQHYFPDNSDQMISKNSVGDEYLEACRLVRVDGQLRVTHDFQLESFQVLPGKSCTPWDSSTGLCSDGASETDFSSNWVSTYRDYVTDFVEEFVTEASDGTVDYPNAKPTINSTSPSVLPSTSPESDNGPPDGTDEAHELVSRGIFIDYMHQILRDRIVDQISKNNDSDPDNDQPILTLAPFFEVNLQLQANWSPIGGDLINVTSEPVPDTNVEYSRGFVTLNNSSGPDTNATAFIEQGNVGLTDTHVIYPLDLDNNGTIDPDERLQDALAYTGSGSELGDPIVAGDIQIGTDMTGRNKLAHSDVIMKDASGGDCERPGAENFECTLNSDGSGSITVTGYSDNNTDAKVCLDDGTQLYAGNVSGDGTESDTTVFEFTASADDRTGFVLEIVEQSGSSLSCAPGQID